MKKVNTFWGILLVIIMLNIPAAVHGQGFGPLCNNQSGFNQRQGNIAYGTFQNGMYWNGSNWVIQLISNAVTGFATGAGYGLTAPRYNNVPASHCVVKTTTYSAPTDQSNAVYYDNGAPVVKEYVKVLSSPRNIHRVKVGCREYVAYTVDQNAEATVPLTSDNVHAVFDGMRRNVLYYEFLYNYQWYKFDR